MRARRVAIAAAVALGAMARAATGDPAAPRELKPPVNEHLHSPSTLHSDGGTDLRLPPGYFLDEKTRDAIDAEMKRLQDAETRLTAENASLVKATDGWQPGWYTLGLTLAAGLALGWYAHSKL